jgi:hypothetical protein
MDSHSEDELREGEEYPGQFDEFSIFPPLPRASEEPPDWLRAAEPSWYRTDDGPVLDVSAAGHDLQVRSSGQGWDILLDGTVQHAAMFDEMLNLLARGGSVLANAIDDAPDARVEARSTLREGFAADLMWWCPTDVAPVINGIVFDYWYGAPAT